MGFSLNPETDWFFFLLASAISLNFLFYTKGLYFLVDEKKRSISIPIKYVLFLFGGLMLLHFLFPLLILGIVRFFSLSSLSVFERQVLDTGFRYSSTALVLTLCILTHKQIPLTLRRFILRSKVGFKARLRDIGLAFLIFLAAFPTANGIDELLQECIALFFGKEIPLQVAVEALMSARETMWQYVSMLFLAVVAAPLLEEYIFRGVFQTFLRGHLGPRGSILLSAAVFSFFHFSPVQGVGNIPLLISLFIFALYLGFCYEKSGSLLTSVSLHMLLNFSSAMRLHYFEG